MSEKVNEKKNAISIYACGGAACNIAVQLEQTLGSDVRAGFAVADIVYIDTSKSNLAGVSKDAKTYLFEGLDGSGKIRRENYTLISESIFDILLKHPPENISIVISSLAGGSGSTIAPALVSELLSREKLVVAIGITSTDSRIEIDNCIKTLKSYEAIANLRKLPVVMLSYNNCKETPRGTVNEAVVADTVRLSALFSGQNSELDSSDLRNWLQYTRVIDRVEPKLVSMKFADQAFDSDKAQVLTSATLAYSGMDTSIGHPVDYQCVGFIAKDNEGNIKLKSATHYLVVDGPIRQIFNNLQAEVTKIDEATKARKRTEQSLVSSSDNVQSDGIVL